VRYAPSARFNCGSATEDKKKNQQQLATKQKHKEQQKLDKAPSKPLAATT
jgi:hypothetical protein